MVEEQRTPKLFWKKKKSIQHLLSIISEQECNKNCLQHEHKNVLQNTLSQNINYKKKQDVSFTGIMGLYLANAQAKLTH